ncbi:MAG TPA: HPP family protein [Humisphaera sp.]
MTSRALALLGIELTPNNHPEKLLSGLGGFAALVVLSAATAWLVGPAAAMPVVASMGASAVLLFAAPHGPLSQPWPVAMGHVLSAAVGVACARWIPVPAVAGAAAVGLSITAMYYARCIHPPGGATALTAVLGGAAVRDLGFAYVLMPVGLNVVLILAVAVAFNAPFRWRRYPAALAHRRAAAAATSLRREDWSHALREIGSMADVTEDELATLHALAARHAKARLVREDESDRPSRHLAVASMN